MAISFFGWGLFIQIFCGLIIGSSGGYYALHYLDESNFYKDNQSLLMTKVIYKGSTSEQIYLDPDINNYFCQINHRDKKYIDKNCNLLGLDQANGDLEISWLDMLITKNEEITANKYLLLKIDKSITDSLKDEQSFDIKIIKKGGDEEFARLKYQFLLGTNIEGDFETKHLKTKLMLARSTGELDLFTNNEDLTCKLYVTDKKYDLSRKCEIFQLEEAEKLNVLKSSKLTNVGKSTATSIVKDTYYVVSLEGDHIAANKLKNKNIDIFGSANSSKKLISFEFNQALFGDLSISNDSLVVPMKEEAVKYVGRRDSNQRKLLKQADWEGTNKKFNCRYSSKNRYHIDNYDDSCVIYKLPANSVKSDFLKSANTLTPPSIYDLNDYEYFVVEFNSNKIYNISDDVTNVGEFEISPYESEDLESFKLDLKHRIEVDGLVGKVDMVVAQNLHPAINTTESKQGFCAFNESLNNAVQCQLVNKSSSNWLTTNGWSSTATSAINGSISQNDYVAIKFTNPLKQNSFNEGTIYFSYEEGENKISHPLNIVGLLGGDIGPKQNAYLLKDFKN